jgi:hypothetical protein
VLLFVMLVVLSLSRDAREIYVLPLLVPVIILATRSIEALNIKAARLLSILTCILLSLLGIVLWIVWAAVNTGRPAWIADRMLSQLPGFVPEFAVIPFVVALAATAAWVVLIARWPWGGGGWLVRWATGWTWVYLLGMTLHVDAANWNMSYRRQFEPLRDVVPADAEAVLSRGMLSTQRGQAHYFGGIRLLDEAVHGRDPGARWYMLQYTDHEDPQPPFPGGAWREIWNAVHDDEVFVLWLREG